jgi:hypothetical protein
MRKHASVRHVARGVLRSNFDDPATDMKTFLIGIMSSGERERAASIASLRGQSVTEWDLFEVENLPNKEAHDSLYATFMASADAYRHFLKLDADMVFRDAHGLAALLDLFKVAGRDLVMTEVHDWASDMLTPGLLAFSNRVRWNINPDRLMVDHAPIFPGAGHRVWGPPAPLVEHSPDPSPFQAFRYGLHRVLKAVQPDRRDKDLRRAVLHWSLLKNIWRAHQRHGDERRLCALLGAEVVLSDLCDRMQVLDNYSGNYVQALFDQLVPDPPGKALDQIYALWEHESANDSRWLGMYLAAPWIERATLADIDRRSTLSG